MNVLLLSTFDIHGGAARSAYRLHQGLQSIGVTSQMLVQYKHSDDEAVLAPRARLEESISRTRVAADALPLKFYSQREKSTFSLQWLPDRTTSRVTQIAPDIINLHWICEAFLQVKTVAKYSQPLVWTLHDMWAFTGGCHYNQECDRYVDSCGACPQLHSHKSWDLSRWVWQRKAKTWKDLNLTIVSPSTWLAKCANNSSLFKNMRVEVIPYGLDTQRYQPFHQQTARKILKLPQDKQLILFGALQATSDKRKGFHLLELALQNLSQYGWKDKLELVILGTSEPEYPPEFGFRTHYLGRLSDDISLALVYSAADVFVAPSVQDNLPNTVLEAIACGVPCVAFKVGGLPDLIEHQQNGYLAQPYEVEGLSQGIAWTLDNEERQKKLSHRAREKVEQEFTLETQARRYQSLFTEILAKDDHELNKIKAAHVHP